MKKAIVGFIVLPAIIGLSVYLPLSTANGQTAYITNWDDNTVSVIDVTTNITDTILVGSYPEGTSVSPDGSRIYIAICEDAH